MTFTDKQKEIVARKLGYDGPMQGFDDFLNSSPSLGMKYATLSDKFATRMAKGGVVRRMYAAGGDVLSNAWKQAEASGDYSKIGGMVSGMSAADVQSKYGLSQADINYIYSRPGVSTSGPVTTTSAVTTAAPVTTAVPVTTKPSPVPASLTNDPIANAWYQAETTGDYSKIGGLISGMSPTQLTSKYGITQADIDYIYTRPGVMGGDASAANLAASKAALEQAQKDLAAAKTEAERLAAQAKLDALNKGNVTMGGISVDAKGAPVMGAVPTITAAQTGTAPGMTPGVVTAGTTQQSGVTQAAGAAPIAAPTPITAQPITAASAAGGVGETLGALTAQQGVVSDAAKITAATQAPETTAVAGVQAAQGVAGTVQGAPTREVQAGEMVTGSAVDMARAEETMAKTQAAQGVVTEEMTVQGQLNKMLTGFDAGAPPPWAAASMRTATAQMAARGLGASSLAGQAIIQATLEAATPIAAADAKVFETMGLQNLSNRQQVAVLVGQQRAAFLGQEFDQAFQTRVLNAARVADIANKNFDAQTQIAIENSRLANSMDIANLSAKNAVVMGKMAQMSQLETTNLNNRQQAAVENAKAFLTMDIKNLDNRQQTALFKAQEMNDALISDAGFSNAVNITNSQNALEAAKVSATLAQNASQFNADMLTKVSMANALAANEIGKFNAQQTNAREEFNSNMANQINIANAKVLAEISTANTASINAANAINAKNATDLSAQAYAQQSQTYRDLLEMSWKTGEAVKDRATTITAATLGYNATMNSAKTTADSNAIGKIATAGVGLLTNYDSVSKAWTDFSKLFKEE